MERHGRKDLCGLWRWDRGEDRALSPTPDTARRQDNGRPIATFDIGAQRPERPAQRYLFIRSAGLAQRQESDRVAVLRIVEHPAGRVDPDRHIEKVTGIENHLS